MGYFGSFFEDSTRIGDYALQKNRRPYGPQKAKKMQREKEQSAKAYKVLARRKPPLP